METITEDEAAQAKRRRETKKLFVYFLLTTVVLAPLLWMGNLQDKQIAQAAAEYRQDCARPTRNSPSCQVLPMQVCEHKEEGRLDPDEETHQWLGLQSKLGQMFEVDTYSPQWDRLSIGAHVTAVVWNGEVEEITDSGGAQQTKANPVRKDVERGNAGVIFGCMFLICPIILLALIGRNILRGRQRLVAGDAGGG